VSSTWRQPRLQIHFGDPVQLDDLGTGPRDFREARIRIDAAITRGLVPLRAAEPDVPRYVDETRPIADHSTASFPGGHVPDDV